MTQPAPTIKFEPRPVDGGPRWQVVATHSCGKQEQITGFATESDAKNWITNDSAAWLRKHGYPPE
jgi:hypothetical protein